MLTTAGETTGNQVFDRWLWTVQGLLHDKMSLPDDEAYLWGLFETGRTAHAAAQKIADDFGE